MEKPDFIINKKGVLTKCKGPGGDVAIPESATWIGDCAFFDCLNLTIHAPAGSKAEKYAKKNNIKFEATEG